MPIPRTEVAAAVLGNEIVVLGGAAPYMGASNALTHTRRRATLGGACRTSLSASITRWRSELAGGFTC